MNYVLDTNAVIYAQKGVLAEGLPLGRHFVSVITIDDEVKRGAIDLRRRHRLRIPDAIVAATAVMLDAELLTNDARLAAVPGLRCRSLPLKST